MGQRTGRYKQAAEESQISHFQIENYSQEKQKEGTEHVWTLMGVMQTREKFNSIKLEFGL